MILAIDQGTTGSTCLVFDGDGRIAGRSYSEFAQHFPRPGWVEHDAGEIWDVTRRVAVEAIVDAGIQGAELDGIGITNQRETVVAWDPKTGEPVHNALVWQDRRTAARCDELREAGHEELVRERTGLVLDPYFSGTKIQWLLENVEAARDGAVFGTVDSWLAFKLTGRHLTDYSNASRTLLFDIRKLAWDGELCDLLGVDPATLPEPVPSAQVYGTTAAFGGEVPVAGIAGDQQAALFGQACHQKGMAKNTYGTGSFVLLNTGAEAPRAARRASSPPSPGAWSPARATRSRRRSSSPAPRCSGFETAWASSGAAGENARAGRLARLQRRRLLRSGADRPRVALVGPLRARDDRRDSRAARDARTWHAPRSRRSPTRRSTPCARRRPPAAPRCPSFAPTAARSPTTG